MVKRVLIDNNMLRNDLNKPKHKFICSGDMEKFTKVYKVEFKEENEILQLELSK